MLIEQLDTLQKKVDKSANDTWKMGVKNAKKLRADTDKFFRKLVKEGQMIQKKAEKDRKKAVSIVMGGLETGRERIESDIDTQWSRVEKVINAGVAKLLERLDVPTSKDIKKLARQVNALSRQVSNLRKSQRA